MIKVSRHFRTIVAFAALGFTVISAGPSIAAEKSDSKPVAVRPDARRVNTKGILPFLTNASCIADCGDGTGWLCTGASVTCVDGVGCSASSSFNGGSTTAKIAIGLC